MNIDLSKLNEEELIKLNISIVRRLHFLSMARMHHQVLHFNIGDRIRFFSAPHRESTATIVRLNRKTISVVTDEGTQWRLSPSYVSLVHKNERSDADTSSRSSLSLVKDHSHKEISRNAPCPCGSGKKYKRCCLPQQQSPLFR